MLQVEREQLEIELEELTKEDEKDLGPGTSRPSHVAAGLLPLEIHWNW